MDWRLKAVAFRVLDLPGGEQAHYFLQRYVTRTLPRPPENLDSLAAKARSIMMDYARHAGGTPETVLEVGAGRDLALPLMLRRLGVQHVTAVDIERLARISLVRHAADHLLSGQFKLETWDDLQRFGVRYWAPHRLAPSDLSVDCSCSNEVLEHVPEAQLVDLLKALRASTKRLTIHSIDYSDHYARSDRSVSRLNFLRYSDEEWRPFNSGKQFVNRLRHSDYVRMLRDAGFTILEESSTVGETPADLKVAEQFRRYDPPDLFAIRGRIVAS